MKRIVIALTVAVIAATASWTKPAVAGVRIGFGLPLALMAAAASQPSYSRGYNRSRAASESYRRKKVRNEQAAADRAAAKRERAAEARRAKEAKQAAARARANKNKDVAKSDGNQRSLPAPVATTAEPVPLGAAPLATAIVPATMPQPLSPAPVQPSNGAVATAIEPSMIQTTASVGEEVKPAVAPAATEATTTRPGDCKKFVPAVGLTITVPCN